MIATRVVETKQETVIMHMADALVSPAVGGTVWALSGGMIVLCARHVQRTMRDNLVPMMGVLGAFVFAAQMINFAIPGTGSSGHLGGGLILALLLGPYAAFLVMASVLTVQALFFADGGLLALGCNIFNLGFLPAFVAYPLVYKPLAGNAGSFRVWVAALAAGIVGLQLGAMGVVLQTTASGITELPFVPFALIMLPIHLLIGIAEGVATAGIAIFVSAARPDLFASASRPVGAQSFRAPLIGFLVLAILLGGAFSWFASTAPDGLEWSVAGVTGGKEIEAPLTAPHAQLSVLQERTAILPDYARKPSGEQGAATYGRGLSGIVGGFLVLLLSAFAGYGLTFRARSPKRGPC